MSAADPACYLCHRPPGKGKRECRPYGPGGSLVCAGCVFGEDTTPDPFRRRANKKLLAEAERQFASRLDSAERASEDGQALITDGLTSGPIPHKPRSKS